MLHLNVAWQLPSLWLYVPVSFLFPTTSDKHSFVELAVSICFGIDLKKILPVVVKTKKAEKPDIFLRTTT